MTIEQKAKCYDDALKMAKKLYEQGTITESLAYIFPELAESEDEKTRKEIIYHIKNCDDTINEETEKRMLAWLENIPYTIDHEKREGFHLGYKTALEKQGEKSLTVDIESMIEAYEQRLINQGNGVRNSPIVNMCVAAFKHGVENTLDELHLKQGETSLILSNSSNIGKDEQKPAWSIKEKLMLNDIIETTERSNIFKENYQRELIEWLKSLKQRIGWKPSDEQITVLELASKYERVFTPKQIDILIGLKEQLKKLTE